MKNLEQKITHQVQKLNQDPQLGQFIELDWNQPDSLIYVSLKSNEYDEMLHDCIREYAYYDEAYTGMPVWIAPAHHIDDIIRDLTIWQNARSRHYHSIQVLAF